MRKTWLHYAKWSKRPKFKPAWSIKTPRKRSPVECNFDHVSHFGLFLGKSLCYWDILWTTLEHYIDGTMVHELDTANNYFCIYEKIKFACFFLAHPVESIPIVRVWGRNRYVVATSAKILSGQQTGNDRNSDYKRYINIDSQKAQKTENQKTQSTANIRHGNG